MRKILVVRFSSIGDIVLTTPVIRALHQQLGAEVHYLTKQKFAGILEANPYIHRIWTIQKEVTEVRRALRQEQFDAIIDLHGNLRSLRLKWMLWQIKSYTFTKLNWQKWLITKIKINRLPDVHIVDRYLQTAAPLGVQSDGKGLDYFLPASAQKLPSAAYAALGLSEDTLTIPPYIAFVIGAAHATKRLPEEQIILICQQLPLPVLLLGGPAEADTGQRICEAVGGNTHNLCGKISLHASAAVVRDAHRVISHDTGLMHIAAAFQQPITSVWGNTVPEFGMYPYYGDHPNQNHTVEVNGLACRPCSKIGYDRCPQGHFRCMREIDVAEVVRASA